MSLYKSESKNICLKKWHIIYKLISKVRFHFTELMSFENFVQSAIIGNKTIILVNKYWIYIIRYCTYITKYRIYMTRFFLKSLSALRIPFSLHPWAKFFIYQESLLGFFYLLNIVILHPLHTMFIYSCLW